MVRHVVRIPEKLVTECLGLHYTADGLAINLNNMIKRDKYDKYEIVLAEYLKAKTEKDLLLQEIVKKYVTEEEMISIFNYGEYAIRIDAVINHLILEDKVCESCAVV